jgi:hypothetical protein
MQYSSPWIVCGGLRFSSWMLVAAAVLIGAVSVRAEMIEYQFSGVVTDDSGNLAVFGPYNGVQVNDVFTGHFSYMTGPGNPDQEVNDPEMGHYNVVDFVIDQATVTITPYAIAVTHEPGMPTLPPDPPNLGTDAFIVYGTYLLGQDMKSVSLRLEAPYQAVFTDDSLPTSLTLNDFTDARVVRSIRVLGLPPHGTSQLDEGQVTSLALVPEPSTAILCLCAISVLLTWRRIIYPADSRCCREIRS